MVFASAYLIRQVKSSEVDIDGLLDIWERAKRANNPAAISNAYHITEGAQTYMDHYVQPTGQTARHTVFKKRTNASYTNGVTIRTPNEPWNLMRYPIQKLMFYGWNDVVGTVWYSPNVVAQLEYSAGLEGVPDSWDAVDDTASAGDYGETCFNHVKENDEWVYEGHSPVNSFYIHHEILSTNIPHFDSQADAQEFTSVAHGYWNGTVTKAQFRAFLSSKMVSP